MKRYKGHIKVDIHSLFIKLRKLKIEWEANY